MCNTERIIENWCTHQRILKGIKKKPQGVITGSRLIYLNNLYGMYQWLLNNKKKICVLSIVIISGCDFTFHV